MEWQRCYLPMWKPETIHSGKIALHKAAISVIAASTQSSFFMEIFYRVPRCTRTSPLPLLPSGPGGIGGIASRGTRRFQF